jgi:D-alanyl-D-alanine dipeptidase
MTDRRAAAGAPRRIGATRMMTGIKTGTSPGIAAGIRAAAIALGCLLAPAIAPPVSAEAMPADFVYLRDVDPSIDQDIRYAGSANFTGAPVPGYAAAECVLVRQAAEALARVQAALAAKGLRLKVYDCYRPARAVSSFVDWAKKPDDPKAKEAYYPNLDKPALFPDYIATRSGHSRGATVDITLLPLDSKAAAPSKSDEPRSCTAPQAGHAPDGSLAHGHALRLLRREGEHGDFRPDRGGAEQPRAAGRGDAGGRLPELSDGMVALHLSARALPGHGLRLSHRAAQVAGLRDFNIIEP